VVIWRVCKYRASKKSKDVDEEDIFEAYSNYWKTKRNSGGIVDKGNILSVRDEKVGRSSYY